MEPRSTTTVTRPSMPYVLMAFDLVHMVSSSLFSSYAVTDPLGMPEKGRKAVQLLRESKEKDIRISSSIKSGTPAREVP